MAFKINNFKTYGQECVETYFESRLLIDTESRPQIGYFFDETTKLWKKTVFIKKMLLGEINEIGPKFVFKDLIDEVLRFEPSNVNETKQKRKLNQKLTKTLNSYNPLRTVINACVKSDVFALNGRKFNMIPHLLPIRGRKCYDFLQETVIPREKEHYFTMECDVGITDSEDELAFARGLFKDFAGGDSDTGNYCHKIFGYSLTGWPTPLIFHIPCIYEKIIHIVSRCLSGTYYSSVFTGGHSITPLDFKKKTLLFYDNNKKRYIDPCVRMTEYGVSVVTNSYFTSNIAKQFIQSEKKQIPSCLNTSDKALVHIPKNDTKWWYERFPTNHQFNKIVEKNIDGIFTVLAKGATAMRQDILNCVSLSKTPRPKQFAFDQLLTIGRNMSEVTELNGFIENVITTVEAKANDTAGLEKKNPIKRKRLLNVLDSSDVVNEKCKRRKINKV